MERRWPSIIFTFIALTLLAPEISASQSEYLIVYKLTGTYRMMNKGEFPYALTEYEKSFILSKNDSWQFFTLLYHDYDELERKIDQDGNLIVVLDLPEYLLPSDNMTINLIYYAGVKRKILPTLDPNESKTIDDIPAELKEKYCKPVGPWKYDVWTELADLAKKLASDEKSVLKVVYSFIRWIKSEIKYESFAFALYPNETYERRAGDCDDQANLLITLCRSVGIPSYLQLGVVYDPGKDRTFSVNNIISRERNLGFHGWAMVYIPPWGWLPVDLTYVYEMKDISSFIERSAISGLETLAIDDVVNEDHIKRGREYRKALHEADLYLEEIFSMEVMQVLYDIEASAIIVMVGFISLLAVSSVVIVLYFIARKRRRSLV